MLTMIGFIILIAIIIYLLIKVWIFEDDIFENKEDIDLLFSYNNKINKSIKDTEIGLQELEADLSINIELQDIFNENVVSKFEELAYKGKQNVKKEKSTTPKVQTKSKKG